MLACPERWNASGGFDVLVYDHRGFGTSNGVPRLEVDPAIQQADWRDAISRFLAARPSAPAEVGVWGSSFAGGLAMVLAATDPRVRAGVAQIPNVFTATDDRLCALPPRVSPSYIDSGFEYYPTWRNEVTLRSVEHMITFEPAGWVPLIGPTPLLMIIAANDRCTFPDVQLDVFAAAREPNRLVVHQGGHFDTYTAHFAETSEPARAWFAEHLRAAQPDEPARTAGV